jgi:hypothetical protein
MSVGLSVSLLSHRALANETTDWSDNHSVLKLIRSLKSPYPSDLPASNPENIEGPLQKEINRRLQVLGEVKINLMGKSNLVFEHPYVMELRYIALKDEQITVRAEALRTLQAIALKDLTGDSSERLNAVKANSELSHLTEVQVLELMVGEIHDRLGVHRVVEGEQTKIDSPILW